MYTHTHIQMCIDPGTCLPTQIGAAAIHTHIIQHHYHYTQGRLSPDLEIDLPTSIPRSIYLPPYPIDLPTSLPPYPPPYSPPYPSIDLSLVSRQIRSGDLVVWRASP